MYSKRRRRNISVVTNVLFDKSKINLRCWKPTEQCHTGSGLNSYPVTDLISSCLQ
jgi:hypothetical protein